MHHALPWQLEIARRSLKKKEKINLIEKRVVVGPGDRCLDLGCAQGILSWFLRKKGGTWVHTDLDFENLQTARDLLGPGFVQMGVPDLPFKSESFDRLFCLDFLEHVDDDRRTAAEITRVLRPGGEMLLVVPRTGRFILMQKIRPAVGLKLEFYGHKREGYTLPQLQALLVEAGLRIARHTYYSRFFTEFLELILNALYVNFFSAKPEAKLRDGHIRPATPGEFAARKKSFKLYKLVFPLFWLFSKLDNLLFFTRGYALMIWAEKAADSKEASDGDRS
ncbi:MAG: class I SAM-dependent methyltransferase [Candidatus Aminicenantes bacterium]|nr:class I SAM-dependent methyltransferase [Candidatus Aminicenantes bacterium]